MIISGGAIIANIGGNTPVAPSALNIFIIKYDAKHVTIPILNLKPKLKLRRWRVWENAIPSVAIAIIDSGKNNSVQNWTQWDRTGIPTDSIFLINAGKSQNEIWSGCKYLSRTVRGVRRESACHDFFTSFPTPSHTSADSESIPSSDNVMCSAITRSVNLKLAFWTNAVALLKTRFSPSRPNVSARNVMYPFSLLSRSHIAPSTSLRWSVVISWVLR